MNNIIELATGIQHFGIPTNDIEKTIAFYNGLGFETVLRTTNVEEDEPVAFLRLKNLVIEAYQNCCAAGVPGAIDHVAIDVIDIEAVFETVRACGYTMLDDNIQFLPFWTRGVRFFTILGPNSEKVEFSQML